MADLGDLVCCLRPEDVVAVAPEQRADCGPCVWASGLIVGNGDLAEISNGINLATEYRFRKPLDLDDPYAPTLCIDDSLDPPVNANGVGPVPCDCNRICEANFRIPKFMAAKCWETTDMYRECTAIRSPIETYITDFISSEYWIRYWERLVLSMLAGITADNLANDGGDMVVDVVNNPLPTVDGSGTTTLLNQFGHIEALATLGCSFGKLDGIIMHRRVWFNLLRAEGNNCCVDKYPSEVIERSPMMRAQGAQVYTYQGYDVYVCDNPVLVDTSGANPVYKTYYFGRGLFHFGEGDLTRRGIRPFEQERDECVNGGFGATKWHSRKAWAVHPMGFSNNWGKVDCAGTNPAADYSNMSLADAANPVFWDRAMDRENIPLAIVCSEG